MDRLDFSLHIGTTGSCVPYRSPSQVHATFMPDAGWTVGRSLPTFARGIEVQIPASTPIRYVSTRHQWFTHVRLLEPYLTELLPPFPQRSPPGLLTPAACGGLEPALQADSGGSSSISDKASPDPHGPDVHSTRPPRISGFS